MRNAMFFIVVTIVITLIHNVSFARSKTHFHVRSGNGFYCNADTFGDDDATTCKGVFDNQAPLTINAVANSLFINMCTDKSGNVCYQYASASACLTKTTRINGNKLKHVVTNRFGKKMTHYDEGNVNTEQVLKVLKFCD